jgi:hypothetical protein
MCFVATKTLLYGTFSTKSSSSLDLTEKPQSGLHHSTTATSMRVAFMLACDWPPWPKPLRTDNQRPPASIWEATKQQLSTDRCCKIET